MHQSNTNKGTNEKMAQHMTIYTIQGMANGTAHVFNEDTGIQYLVPVGSVHDHLYDPQVSFTRAIEMMPVEVLRVVVLPEPTAPPLPAVVNTKKRDAPSKEEEACTICNITDDKPQIDFACGNHDHRGHRECLTSDACPLCSGAVVVDFSKRWCGSRNVRGRF